MSKYGEPWSVTQLEQDGDTFLFLQDIEGNDVIPSVAQGSMHDAEEHVYRQIAASINALSGWNPEAVRAYMEADAALECDFWKAPVPCNCRGCRARACKETT